MRPAPNQGREDTMTTTIAPAPSAAQATVTLPGAEVLLRALVEQGVEVIFGYPGGAVLPIYDALFRQNHIRHILVRHEQAAVHAAEAYARSTGKVGVVLVTSGPGATNAVTGLLDAMMDSIPLVCLSGQVPTALIGNDAFQEADTTGITRPVTKYNYLVRRPEDLAPAVHEAFAIARSGRPGPVLVDLPKNITVGDAPYISAQAVTPRTGKIRTTPDRAAVSRAVAAMKAARRPLFYIGGGVINSGPQASEALRKLAKLTGFPVTSTLMGLGAYPATDSQFLGMLGMHGTYEANLATHGCDVLVALGSRFDDRVTGRVNAFSPGSFKIHVDIDPSQINKIVHVDEGIVGDVGETIAMMIEEWLKPPAYAHAADLTAWWAQIEGWRALDCLRFKQDQAPDAVIKPQQAISRIFELGRQTGRDMYVSTEVGQHQMWAAQFFKFDKPNRWLTSGGLGTMGYGLPAAVGAQVAHPDALVMDIAGEASTLMNIQELGTIAQYRLPVKIFIINNHYMGMVRQWQELLHGSRYSESYSDALPDFVKLAESFHARGLRVTRLDQLDDTIREALAHDGPVMVDICVAEGENCFPMIPSGAAHNEMILGPEQEDSGAQISQEGQMLV
ncbi:biosynthetic-type acetolactate synthase large subunit [Acetobacter sp. TBRC 12305]|uniref:Acetolactate synthase n=1 Tax=Acetobacter garciniae TaxID=2817435 RepID=A0A939HQW4_9PROT|nr:biosynthetic-type acetolactate synthase large subunit [Acetobacter garciniae]MBX0346153.1 biosynthetic-type acetolactate synthase large subunit [Acetobacter garciniae]